MAFERFGSARLSDDLPIDDWMDSQNEAVARRDDLAAAGRDAWVASTESGANLGAARPGDVVALGDISPGNTAHAPASENLVTRVARSPAGPGIAHGLGFAAGIMRGAAHTVEGLGQAALLSVRFGNPGIDRLLTPFTGGTAGQQVARRSPSLRTPSQGG